MYLQKNKIASVPNPHNVVYIKFYTDIKVHLNNDCMLLFIE